MKYLLISTILFSFTAFSQLPKLYTTRLLSTSGAGVASILANESAVLNPAPIAFLSISSFYYQKDSSELTNESCSRVKNSGDSKNQMYLIADTSGSVKGTFSYQKVTAHGLEKQSYVSSLASLIGKRTSMGFTLRHNKLRNSDNSLDEKYNDLVLGLTYIHNPKLTFGITYEDPFKSSDDHSIVRAGMQFKIFRSMIFLQDFSFSTRESFDDTNGSRSAVQLNVFKDFFLRLGRFSDNYTSEEGSSYGLSWIGPKLSLEYSVMKSEFTEDTATHFKNEKERIQSFSVSIRF